MIKEYIVILKSETYVYKFKSFLHVHNMYFEYLNDSRSFLIKTNEQCVNCISNLYYVQDIDNNIEEEVELEPVIPIIPPTPEDPEEPGDTQYLNWGINKMNIPSLWKKGYTGQGIKVAVLDTGIAEHPDLVVKGHVSFVDGQDPKDVYGHGTQIAGIIAGRGFDINAYGVAYDCDLYNVKVISNTGTVDTWDLCQGIQWCIDNKMNVLNISIAWRSPINPKELTALENVIIRAYDAGVIIVFSSGNDSRPVLYPPAADKPSISIGAVDVHDNLWPQSNYGFGLNYVAPGVNITTTIMPNLYTKYSLATGTSFATPQVVGLIALLLSYNKNLTQGEIENILNKSAIDLGGSGYDDMYGYGRVNAPNL